jgi:Xaa-Pro aminopeptidase
VDGCRYHLQAEQQLDMDVWTLMRQGREGVPSLEEYLKSRLPPGSVVALDGTISSAKFVSNLQASLRESGIEVKVLATTEGESNFADDVWTTYRPPCPDAPARVHPLQYAGERYSIFIYSCVVYLNLSYFNPFYLILSLSLQTNKKTSIQSKLNRIGEKMEEEGAQVLVLCALDDIAYTFNIRGDDIPNSPVPNAFALIEKELGGKSKDEEGSKNEKGGTKATQVGGVKETKNNNKK